ncbi:MAG: hypothetical protein J5J00_12560 [Deltaproteobacteria bacterium]|nr:hypothetical protein [Deltaproteobacteria bacterium]
MCSLKRTSALFAFLFAVLFSPYVQAQNETVHGAAIVPARGGGCFFTGSNAPLSNPFVEPSVSNAIYCLSRFGNIVTYQGEGAPNSPAVGQTTFAPSAKTTFSDTLDNTYSQMALNSEYRYCGGQSCYPGEKEDGSGRRAFLALNIPKTVKAINAKDEPNENLAFRMASTYIVDGKGIGYSIEGDQQLLVLAKDEKRIFEITPVAPDFNDQAALRDASRNPYSIRWVTPDLSSTPHKEIPSGIFFKSEFYAGQWRYYVHVDGSQLPAIGKYIVNFVLRRETPVVVSVKYRSPEYNQQYCPKGTCDFNAKVYTTGTFTVAYGTEQCLKRGGIALPSYAPLMAVYTNTLGVLKKSFKLVFETLDRLPQNNKFRDKARRTRRQIQQAHTFVKGAIDFEQSNLRSLTELYTSAELGALSEQLVAKAVEAIVEPKGVKNRRNTNSLRRLIKNYTRTVKYAKANAKGGKAVARKYAKLEKSLKNAIIAADKAFNEYATQMQVTMERDRDIRENSFRCTEVF